MNRKQYKNIVKNSVKSISNDTCEDSVKYIRAILKNMGIPLPQGNCKTIHDILRSNDYMFWQACNLEDVQNAIDQGFAVIGLTDNSIVLIDNNEPNEESTVKSTLPHIYAANKLIDTCDSETSTMSYYSYNGRSTTSTDILESAYFYLNNKYFGKYLRRVNNVPQIARGKLSVLFDSIVWKIEKDKDNYYAIRVGETEKYLCVDGSALTLATVTGSVPSHCKWVCSIAYGGGVIFRNKYNNKYLSCDNSKLTLKSSLGEKGSESYYSCVWRKILATTYGYSENCYYHELTSFDIDFSGFSVGDILIPKIKANPNRSIWVEPTDFNFVSMNSNYASVNTHTSAISAKNAGTVNIQATHKVTGISKTFTVTIAGFSTSGNYGSVIFKGDVYKIVLPSSSDDFAGWRSVDEIPDDDIRYGFDIFKFLVGFQADDLNGVANGENVANLRTDQMLKTSIFGLVLGIPSGIEAGVDVEKIFYKFNFYEKNGIRLATIQVGSNKVQSLYNKYADGKQHSYAKGPNNEITTTGFALRSADVAEYYEKITGESLNKWHTHDLVLTADTKHKSDMYSSYLWVNSSGEFMEKPFVYDDDRAQIGRIHGFLYSDFTPYLDLPLNISAKAADYYQEMLGPAVEEHGIEF